MKIQILLDNPKSWFIKYINVLVESIKKMNHDVIFVMDSNKITKGDLVFILSCDKIIPEKVLKLNRHNLVIHASDVPKGRGWSPMTWQILDGKDTIPISLFEASLEVDSGDVYMKDYIKLDGTELIDESRNILGNKVCKMVMDFLKLYPNIKGEKQQGDASFTKKRKPEDSEFNINKTIKEQFNLLRVVDNKNYPAFFIYKGSKYILSIKKEK